MVKNKWSRFQWFLTSVQDCVLKLNGSFFQSLYLYSLITLSLFLVWEKKWLDRLPRPSKVCVWPQQLLLSSRISWPATDKTKKILRNEINSSQLWFRRVFVALKWSLSHCLSEVFISCLQPLQLLSLMAYLNLGASPRLRVYSHANIFTVTTLTKCNV